MFRLGLGFRISIFVWILVILPVLIQLPALTGLFDPDPSLFFGNFGDHVHISGGLPWGDPNVGYQGQALGKLSADQWLSYQLPWWNFFNGTGLPLAAEMQPASLFLPFVLLYHFRAGGLWVELLLQIIAGLCTYGLLRKLKLTALAAFVGGILFEFNGTFAWHGAPITSPVAFLPMLLLGIELLRERVRTASRGGWFLVSLALAWSIYAGFPETAYIDGLLAGAWVLTRLSGLERATQLRFILKLGAASLVGILFSIPQLVPFAEYLTMSDIGGHAGAFTHMHMPAAGFAVSMMPWLYGPVAGYSGQVEALFTTWGSLGGYFTALQIALACLGVVLMPRRLSLVLFAWMLVCLGKTFDWYIFSDLLNLFPMIKSAAFFRYASPSWEMAGTVLVAFGLDGLCRKVPVSNKRVSAIFLIILFLVAVGLWLSQSIISGLLKVPGYRFYLIIALGWLIFSLVAGAILIIFKRDKQNFIYPLAALLCLDACVAFMLPIYSGARDTQYGEQGISFLQPKIGINRVYSLGPLAANYGAYYGIAQINHNQLPIDKDWINYIHRHLDPFADAVTFIGEEQRTDHRVTVEQELRANLEGYEAIDVKYIVAPPGTDPFTKVISTDITNIGNKPLALKNDDSTTVSWIIPPDFSGEAIESLSVFLGNYGNQADGQLTARICIAQGPCVAGTNEVKNSKDNALFNIHLDQSLVVPSAGDRTLRITLLYKRSTHDLALWLWPLKAGSQQRLTMDGAEADFAPSIHLLFKHKNADASGKLVYGGTDMSIYELPKSKDYFETTGNSCRVDSISRVEADIDCSGPAKLLRRETFYPGWKATINERPVPIERASEIFQQIDLVGGRQRVKFEYRPSHFSAIVFGFFLGLFALCFGLFQDLRNKFAWMRG